MFVTNRDARRSFIVRTGGAPKDGGDKPIKIHPGQTVDVPGFDPSDPVHAGWIAEGALIVGSSGAQSKREEKLERMRAALAKAETDYKNAMDAAAAAEKALEEKDEPAQRKALASAQQQAKAALTQGQRIRDDMERAEAAG